jgi:hypothetical protein
VFPLNASKDMNASKDKGFVLKRGLGDEQVANCDLKHDLPRIHQRLLTVV